MTEPYDHTQNPYPKKRDVCRECHRSIHFVGPHWMHDDETDKLMMRHNAMPRDAPPTPAQEPKENEQESNCCSAHKALQRIWNIYANSPGDADVEWAEWAWKLAEAITDAARSEGITPLPELNNLLVALDGQSLNLVHKHTK